MKLSTIERALLVVLALLLFAVPLQAQTTIHVDDDAPGDPGPGDPAISDPLEDGSPDHPYDAIQEAMDAAATGSVVLLADGRYAGAGNHDLSFLGRKITVRSANGPQNCTVDCEGVSGLDRFGFEFVSGEVAASVLQGLTITGASDDEGAPGHPHGIYIDGGSPTIIGNVVTGCTGGAGICCLDSAARITGNTLSGNSATQGGGLLAVGGSPRIDHNRITGNLAAEHGGGICLISAEPASLANNLLAGNHADLSGGGLYGLDLDTDSGVTTLRNSTIAGNSAGTVDGDGGGICLAVSGSLETCTVDLVDCIVAHNLAGEGANLWLGSEGPSISGAVTATLDHCLIRDASSTVRVGHMTLIQASPVLTGDPLFIAGPHGEHYLSQTADGQAEDSPGLDAGSDLAMNICTGGGDETLCLDTLTTRTSGVADTGIADLGYHYPAAPGTVAASMACSPAAGTLPFSSQFTLSLTNTYAGQTRRVQHKIDVTLAGGQYRLILAAGLAERPGRPDPHHQLVAGHTKPEDAGR